MKNKSNNGSNWLISFSTDNEEKKKFSLSDLGYMVVEIQKPEVNNGKDKDTSISKNTLNFLEYKSP